MAEFDAMLRAIARHLESRLKGRRMHTATASVVVGIAALTPALKHFLRGLRINMSVNMSVRYAHPAAGPSLVAADPNLLESQSPPRLTVISDEQQAASSPHRP